MNQLLNSQAAILTIEQLPTDNTKIVTSPPKELAITDRLYDVFEAYGSSIIQKDTTNSAPNAVTATIPIELANTLIQILSSTSSENYPETSNMIAILQGLISRGQEERIDFTRGNWKQMSRVFEELKFKECDINKLSAAMRAMAMPISTDVTTIADEGLLDSSISYAVADQEMWLDEDFKTEYADVIDDPIHVPDMLTDVLAQNPSTVGNPSTTSSTNKVEFDPSASADNMPIVDLDEKDSIMNDALDGLEALFSTANLETPLKDIKELGIRKDTEGSDILSYWDIEALDVSILNMNTPDGQVMGTAKAVKDMFTNRKVHVLMEKENVKLDQVDTSKSLLEQDWGVSSDLRFQGQRADIDEWPSNLRSDVMSVTDPNFITLINSIEKKRTNVMFTGLRSQKRYTVSQVRGLSNGLAAIWGKMKNMKLPSPSTVSAATSLLATGLGAIGGITGCAGLQTASNVMGCLSEGIGAFAKPSSVEVNRSVQKVDKEAQILRHSLSVVPCLIRAGKARLERDTVSAQQNRLSNLSYARKIKTAYTKNGQGGKLVRSLQTGTPGGNAIEDEVEKIKRQVKRSLAFRRK